MKVSKVMSSLALVAVMGSAWADGNNISPSMKAIDVMHNGKAFTISRSGDQKAEIPAAYDKVARHCPPFCIQPMTVVPGVETIGELEVLGYLKRVSNGDRSILVVDSRTPEWVQRGTIPGSVNIPWNKINVDMAGTFEVEAEADTLHHILADEFGAHMVNGQWDFRNAKTLVMFCNGAWCPQSSVNIKTLTKLGYPAYKIKWYRGGMQDWVSLGLTTVQP